MQLWRTSRRRFITLLVAGAGISACSKAIDPIKVVNAEFDFRSMQKTYINQTEFSFDTNFKETGHEGTPTVSVLVFDSQNCSGTSTKQDQTSFDTMHVTGLQDGHTYSFKVNLAYDDVSYRSTCTPWVGIDLQTPPPVAVQFPPTDTYTTATLFQAQWGAVVDNGIAGLQDKSYRYKLYSQAHCAGSAVLTDETAASTYTFTGLTNGVFYSYQVSAIDKAGNESPGTCSSTMEIDVNGPGLTLTDSVAGADAGYSKTLATNVTLTNDSWAGYWCLTTDSSFVPSSPSSACPSGQGSSNGWFTTRPTNYTLSSGDGVKNVYLWLLNGSGQLVSNKHPLASVTLDQTSPAVFTVSGITGDIDSTLNAYLSDSGDPTVHWNTPIETNPNEFLVEILNGDTSTRCQGTAGSSATSLKVTGCNLSSTGSYFARVTAKDHSGNSRSSANFAFTVDIVPPAAFTISGVRGLNDATTDTWTSGAPIVDWTASTDAVKYHVDIRDPVTSTTMCGGEQSVTAPTLTFDFTALTCSTFISGSSYEAYVRSEDDAGLFTTATSQPFVFRVDLDAPIITVSSTPPSLGNNTTAVYNFSVADPLSGVALVECSFNGAAFAACANSKTFAALADGTYNFRVRATDNVGNVRLYTHNFEIDTTGPTTTISGAPTAYVGVGVASFTFGAVDTGSAGVASYQCKLDSGTWTTCTSIYSVNSLAEGAHTMSIRSVDALGNVGTAATSGWTVDFTGPTITINSWPGASTGLATAAFDFSLADSASGVSGSQCQFNGGAWTACTSPKSYTNLIPGSYTVKIKATDNVGNTTTQTYPFTVVVQSAAPNAYSFTNLTGQTASTLTASNIVAITGLTGNIATSISGNSGEYRICADSICTSPVLNWTTSSSTIQNGQYLQLRQTTSASASTTLSTTVTTGTASQTWSVSTP